jgi:hypothetical protein
MKYGEGGWYSEIPQEAITTMQDVTIAANGDVEKFIETIPIKLRTPITNMRH